MNSSAEPARAARSIPIRKPTFSYEGERPYWVKGEPSLTHLLHALSAAFPDGERMFMDSVAHYRKEISDPTLRREVASFLAQEANHAKAHEEFNAWIAAQGFDMSALDASVKARIALGQKAPPIVRLAVTCALEHFTAIMAEQLLEEPELIADFDPKMAELWLWHAVEETEHKAVAFDVYQAVDGSYPRRVLVMAIVTIRFISHIAWMKSHLMKTDPKSGGFGSRLRGMWTMWGNPGWFRRLVPAYLDYFRRDFHPWDRDVSVALERARTRIAERARATTAEAA